MTAVSIRVEKAGSGKRSFRAIAGDRQTVGRTMGEALDALTAEWDDDVQEAAILIQRFGSDIYFTQAQHDRMQELNARRNALTPEERHELEELIDAELAATIARTQSVTPQSAP